MSLFVTYIKNKKRKLFLLLVLILLNSLSLIPIPYLTKYLVDVVLLEGKYDEIWLYISIITVIIGLQLVFGRINVKFSAYFFQEFLYDIRKIYLKTIFLLMM
ncbi:hypothetical protein LI954_16025 [Enterococcus sp. CWB-B31]|nr:hypothetical protein [Enterococcus sp. CWB-B31]